MFSPIVAARWVNSSSIVRPLGGKIALSDCAPGRLQVVGDPRHRSDELVEDRVAGDEVGFRVDLDNRAAVAGDRDADQTFGGDPAGPLRRGRESPSYAANRPPPPGRRSSPFSAFLQSIMPALVLSRSASTRLALISAILQLFPPCGPLNDG